MKRRAFFTSPAADAPSEPGVPPVWFERFGNATLRTHEDKPVRVYDDLIKGKTSLINLMYATCEGNCPVVTSNLLRVYEKLKPRMGKDLFIYSITAKPEDDDPAALKEYAQMHRALLPGWTFLTGDPYDIETLRFRLFRWDHILFDTDISLHTGMVRIVNDNTRRWTHTNPLASMNFILWCIAQADPPKTFKEQVEANKKLQEQIDKEVKMYGYRKTV
jgi:protein SCO1